MQALEFWQTVTVDKSDFLGQFVSLLKANAIRYCVIGGQAVNAYVEPLVSLDLDVVIATEDDARARELLSQRFEIAEFPRSVNVSAPSSDLRVQLQTDQRYKPFVDNATEREVLGLTLPVAALDDLMRGKVWAAQDPTRRGSKRQKDLADIARLLEAYPTLRPLVPADILERIA